MKITADQIDFFWVMISMVFCVTVLASAMYVGIFSN